MSKHDSEARGITRRSFLGAGEISEKWRAELDKLKA